MITAAPVAPGRIGEAIEPAILQAYLGELENWIRTRRVELDDLDQAALTAQADGRKNADGTPLMVSCQSGVGASASSGCGCGPGLSWCLPAGTYNTSFPGGILTASRNVLLGTDDPTDQDKDQRQMKREGRQLRPAILVGVDMDGIPMRLGEHAIAALFQGRRIGIDRRDRKSVV